MTRRGDETPTEGGEALAARPQSSCQTARQSSDAQLATVAPLLTWLMSHPAAWAMGRMAARTSRASCRAATAPRGRAAEQRQRPPRASRRAARASCRAATAPTEGEPIEQMATAVVRAARTSCNSAHRGRAHRARISAHRGRSAARRAATAPTEGELQCSEHVEQRQRPPSASCSGAKALTPIMGDGEALPRDGPRCSRHASEAADARRGPGGDIGA